MPPETSRAADPLLSSAGLQRYLRAHRLPPLERFGQHFLIDADVLRDIVEAAESDPAIPIVEIGAGLGILTRAIAEERRRKIGSRHEAVGSRELAPIAAVELDRRLVPLLRERVRDFPEVRVVHADILKTDIASLLAPRSPEGEVGLPTSYSPPTTHFDIIGNIPYNITAPILEKFLSVPPRLPRTDAERLVRGPRRMTILLDEAVAAAICAQPPDLSVRAISVQLFARPVIVRRIPPSAFVPPPAVHSALVVFTIRPSIIPEHDLGRFFHLVRAGFSQRRKTLANALAAAYRMPPADAAARLRRARIDPRRRAETLSLADWKRLLRAWGP